MHEMIVLAREIPLRTLDLDHPRAGFGQLAREIGRGHGLFDGYDEHAFEI
jgi:hypothetical protein